MQVYDMPDERGHFGPFGGVFVAETLVEANKRQLNTGDVRMTDYLLSISNFLNLRTSLIQNNMMRLSLINQLNYLILK